MASMREGFGGPPTAGYGWSPSAEDVAASPATGGWGDSQTVAVGKCRQQCEEGCNGTHCKNYCEETCRDVV